MSKLLGEGKIRGIYESEENFWRIYPAFINKLFDEGMPDMWLALFSYPEKEKKVKTEKLLKSELKKGGYTRVFIARDSWRCDKKGRFRIACDVRFPSATKNWLAATHMGFFDDDKKGVIFIWQKLKSDVSILRANWALLAKEIFNIALCYFED